MKDVNNFVLMGKAYIDFTSDKATDAATMDAAIQADPISSGYSEVVPTAESVALKTNQQLYLVPPDFLDGANPAEDSLPSHTFTISIPDSDLLLLFLCHFTFIPHSPSRQAFSSPSQRIRQS